MSGRRLYRVYKSVESPFTEDLVEIMKNGNGPFKQKYLWEKLAERHPHLSHQELKIHVSYALYYDRYENDKIKKFIVIHRGLYDLIKPEDSYCI
jgi:hypothetical protein